MEPLLLIARVRHRVRLAVLSQLHTCRPLMCFAAACSRGMQFGDFILKGVHVRNAGLRRVHARGLADTFGKTFPVCASGELSNTCEFLDAGIVKHAVYIIRRESRLASRRGAFVMVAGESAQTN